MLYEITRMELSEPDRFGNSNIIIKQVKMMDDNGKYIKFAKLTNELINDLKQSKVTIKNT